MFVSQLMCKIDKEGNLKDGGSISLNLTELLSLLFSEKVSSGKSFDKKAKKIIRSQYKLISNKNFDEFTREKIEPTQSERKDYSSRTALSALAAQNTSTLESDPSKINDALNGSKIVNYYNAEGN